MSRMIDVTEPCPVHRAVCSMQRWGPLRALCALDVAAMQFVRDRIDRRLARMERAEYPAPEAPKIHIPVQPDRPAKEVAADVTEME